MALSGFLFISWRILQILTLIPLVGMLSFFVNRFINVLFLTPNYVLVLFVVSVLALAWTVATLFAYSRPRHSGFFVAFIDLCLMGAFIAGVVELRAIESADCGNTAQSNGFWSNPGRLGPLGQGQEVFGYDEPWSKTCAMLKASFAFGILNAIVFFFTFVSISQDHRESRLLNLHKRSFSLCLWAAITRKKTRSSLSASIRADTPAGDHIAEIQGITTVLITHGAVPRAATAGPVAELAHTTRRFCSATMVELGDRNRGWRRRC